MRRSRSRTLSTLVVPLVVAGALVVPGTVVAGADPLAASTLTKSVRTATTPVDHGGTAAWIIDYDNNTTATGAATVTDQIASTHAYVPGSLRVPPGWTPQWSTDGTTFQNTEPASGTVAVRAANPAARPGGTVLASQLTPPVQAAVTATGGDGFTPLLHRTPSGSLQAWNIFHHAGPNAPKVVCSELATGSLCAGGPWPKVLNTAVGPLQTGSGDIFSPLEPQYVRDPVAPHQVYYAAITAASVGVGCLDLAAVANCGYWPLLATGGPVNNLAGLVEAGGNLYGVATSGVVTCWNIASKAACGGQPYAAIVPPNGHTPSNPGNVLYLGAMTVAGGKVFASSSPQAGQVPAMGCFDPATNAACSGWASPLPLGPANNYAYNAYTAYDSGGAAVGACATTTGAANVTTCYTIAGGALASPSAFTTLGGGVLAFAPEVVVGPDGHTRSYLPVWGGGIAGAALCHDWTTGANCAGFPNPATHPNVNGGATRDYGYAYDATTGCLIGLGDAGVLFSMDPATGGSPCARSGAEVMLTPSAFYCDGNNHVTGYGSARLEGITPANVNFAASTVSVVDQNGATVPTPGFAPDGSVDLTGVSATTHTSLTVTTQLVLNSGADFSGGAKPNLVVDFVGDPPQVCFKTTVATACTVTDVVNTATGTDASGSFTSNTVSVPVAPGPACQPVVRTEKEICASHRAADCGPGGAGPWVKQTPVGLLGALFGTARWRITITNDGPVAVDDVTVYDLDEPSCETAGGTFSLAPGQSKQIYCSTYAVITLFPITNHAKAKYTPRNSPAGTQPSYSPYSSAKACALFCNNT
ncbi:MAG: hypothetical protein HOY78_32705 [Saccharothrix sp.]|nr:hypothetical protein [Saccharothrix sp.]